MMTGVGDKRSSGAARSARAETMLELVQMGTGVALVGFMWSHVCLVSSVLLGASVMNQLAGFLERTQLAFWGAPVVVALFFVHAILAARKIPFQLTERAEYTERMRELKHWDSITWGAQVVTGMAVLILGAIHLWVILTDFPITAEKSGARVFGPYLMFYIPLLLAVEVHASVGLYRAAMKWGSLDRATLHRIGTLLTIFFLALGTATMVALWKLGALGAGA